MGYIVLLLGNQIRDIFRINDNNDYNMNNNNISINIITSNLLHC